MAENQLGPRLERVPGVAAVTTSGGLRRQIHVELSKEKITALDLLGRSRRRRASHGEPEHSARRGQPGRPDVPAPQPGPVPEPRRNPQPRGDDARRRAHLSSRTSPRSSDTTEDIRSMLRINGHPGVRMQVHEAVGHEHRADRRGRPRGDRAHQPRGARHQAHDVLDDSAVYIERSINSVQEHAMLGAVLVIAHHLPVPAELPIDAHRLHVDSDFGRRHLRAALFRRLYAEHDDVRRSRARHRHDRRRGDRRARELVPPHGDTARIA